MKFSIEIKGKKYDVSIDKKKDNTGVYNLVINSIPIEVRVIDENESQLPENNIRLQQTAPGKKQPVKSSGNEVSVKVITAPMPGTVISILVKEGQEIIKGKEVVTMETMKMNVPIFAPENGKVKKILIKEGESISTNQPLIEFN